MFTYVKELFTPVKVHSRKDKTNENMTCYIRSGNIKHICPQMSDARKPVDRNVNLEINSDKNPLNS